MVFPIKWDCGVLHSSTAAAVANQPGQSVEADKTCFITEVLKAKQTHTEDTGIATRVAHKHLATFCMGA